MGIYKIVNGRVIESSEEGGDVPVTISDVRGLSPRETTPSGRKVSGVREIIPDKDVEENIKKARDAVRFAGGLPGLEFSDDGTYRTVREKSLVGDSIKNTGVEGALRNEYRRMYLHDKDDGGYKLSDDPLSLAERDDKVTERPPLSTLADEDEGETPLTERPPLSTLADEDEGETPLTERPSLSTLADEDEGETPITVIPSDFEG